MKRKVVAIWEGDGADGSGVLTAQSGAFNNMPYSFKTRFENDNGQLGTNPEELIAAAHAGCFNMKLSFVLNEANFNPEELNTEALLTFLDGKIVSIELNLQAKVPGITKEKFNELAEDAKANCPISGVLNCEIILNSVLL
jgi:osmotically inducible protein OsmC